MGPDYVIIKASLCNYRPSSSSMLAKVAIGFSCVGILIPKENNVSLFLEFYHNSEGNPVRASCSVLSQSLYSGC